MVLFDEALLAVVHWVQQHRDSLGEEANLLRDLAGKLRVVLPPDQSLSPEARKELHQALGAYSPGEGYLVWQTEEPAEQQEVLASRVQLGPPAEGAQRIYLVDRLAAEHLWEATPVPQGERAVPRLVFFGVKGGVGRSTALVALSQYLARKKRVLVVDLDLESPGVTSFLLPVGGLPEHGVVDWLVEEVTGQAEQVVPSMSAISPLSDLDGISGTIFVVPAVGNCSIPALGEQPLFDELLRDGAYTAKLGRIYASLSGHDLASRLDEMLKALERTLSPDVILLDSRAGIHEISAATLPRLNSTVLLFATPGEQTWLGYQLLFSSWRRDASVTARFRERLQVVAALVPETMRKEYTDRLNGISHQTFTSFIYEQDEVGAQTESFNYSLTDDEAPHFSWPIYWRRELMDWNPKDPASLSEEQFSAAFQPFLKKAMAILFPEETDDET